MALIAKARLRGDFNQRKILKKQLSSQIHAALKLETMRRHTRYFPESLEKHVGRVAKTGSQLIQCHLSGRIMPQVFLGVLDDFAPRRYGIELFSAFTFTSFSAERLSKKRLSVNRFSLLLWFLLRKERILRLLHTQQRYEKSPRRGLYL